MHLKLNICIKTFEWNLYRSSVAKRNYLLLQHPKDEELNYEKCIFVQMVDS